MRLFIGIPVSEEIKAKIKPFYIQLERIGADLNLVSLENLHFTLKFLGEVEEPKILEIKSKLETVKPSPFSVSLEELGFFPSEQRINVLWVGIKSKELVSLMREINSRLNYIRKDEHETEIPHLTLARIKSGQNKEQLLELINENQSTIFGQMVINQFFLYQSQLTPQGPVYKVLAEFKLYI